MSVPEFVVVHIRFGFALSPPARDFVGVHQLELSVGTLPCDETHVARVAQQLQQKLPQLDLT